MFEEVEQVGEVAAVEVAQRLFRRTEVGQATAGRQDEQPVAQVQLGGVMGDYHHRSAVVGQAAQGLHY